MSVPNPERSGPPPLKLDAVRAARARIDTTREWSSIWTSAEREMAALLEAYDALAARLAWLSAQHAECQR